MDFLSIILAAIGWGKDRASKVSDYRIEAYRLNAEVASEAASVVNMLTLVTPDILRRVQALWPDQPEVHTSCSDTLRTMRNQAEQLRLMAEGYKAEIEKAGNGTDWEKLLRRLHEWRATAAKAQPEAEAIIKRYETILATGEVESRPPSSQPVGFRERDRGWDAPPL
ncbi:hypothetical protein EFR00_30430 [Rhizobium sophoriradicis]|uniref:hypothetical protein n=1 Tax=Rhizobium sophoriradicis TaxID=1535245 RepID=UPI00098ED395|nr:hypothetical protein [Rhizobium sophoriradicis]RSB82465.1 hypothetical protein EFR00_30430 [Rhizobium sophoriradicis]